MTKRVSIGVFIAGFCVLTWFVWSLRESRTRTTHAGADSSVVERSIPGQPTVQGLADGSLGANGSAAIIARGSSRPVPSGPRVNAPTMIGPQPLTLENEQRLEAFADQAAGYGGRFRDFYELAKTEEPDPAWSEAVEQQLRQAIIRNGAKFTGIQTRAPHCTRTVCMLVATGGQGSEVANADWQRLMGLLMNEPWFRENFDDTHSAVQSSPAGVMYISFFIRKG